MKAAVSCCQLHWVGEDRSIILEFYRWLFGLASYTWCHQSYRKSKNILSQYRQGPSGHSLMEINIQGRIVFALISLCAHKACKRHKSLRTHPWEQSRFCFAVSCHGVMSGYSCLLYHLIYPNEKLLLGLSFLYWHHYSFWAQFYFKKGMERYWCHC